MKESELRNQSLIMLPGIDVGTSIITSSPVTGTPLELSHEEAVTWRELREGGTFPESNPAARKWREMGLIFACVAESTIRFGDNMVLIQSSDTMLHASIMLQVEGCEEALDRDQVDHVYQLVAHEKRYALLHDGTVIYQGSHINELGCQLMDCLIRDASAEGLLLRASLLQLEGECLLLVCRHRDFLGAVLADLLQQPEAALFAYNAVCLTNTGRLVPLPERLYLTEPESLQSNWDTSEWPVVERDGGPVYLCPQPNHKASPEFEIATIVSLVADPAGQLTTRKILPKADLIETLVCCGKPAAGTWHSSQALALSGLVERHANVQFQSNNATESVRAIRQLADPPQEKRQPDEHSRTLVLYSYFETDSYAENLRYFLDHGLNQTDDFVFIINGETCTPQIPRRKNVSVIYRENFGLDFAGWDTGLQQRDLAAYDYFIFLNCTVRGPFLPVWAESLNWSRLLTGMIDDSVKLAGSALNYHYGVPHLLSSLLCTDHVGLRLGLDQGIFFEQQLDYKPDVGDQREIAFSSAILKAGYDIRSLMTAYRHVDWQQDKSLDLAANVRGADPLTHQGYFGQDAHPYELIFVKSDRNTGDDRLKAMTDWHNGELPQGPLRQLPFCLPFCEAALIHSDIDRLLVISERKLDECLPYFLNLLMLWRLSGSKLISVTTTPGDGSVPRQVELHATTDKPGQMDSLRGSLEVSHNPAVVIVVEEDLAMLFKLIENLQAKLSRDIWLFLDWTNCGPAFRALASTALISAELVNQPDEQVVSGEYEPITSLALNKALAS